MQQVRASNTLQLQHLAEGLLWRSLVTECLGSVNLQQRCLERVQHSEGRTSSTLMKWKQFLTIMRAILLLWGRGEPNAHKPVVRWCDLYWCYPCIIQYCT